MQMLLVVFIRYFENLTLPPNTLYIYGMLIAEMLRWRQNCKIFIFLQASLYFIRQPISNAYISFYLNIIFVLFRIHSFLFPPLGVTLPRRRRWRWRWRHLWSAGCLQIERRCVVERTVATWRPHRRLLTYLSIWIIKETLWHGQHFDGYLLRLGGWLMDVSCNKTIKII